MSMRPARTTSLRRMMAVQLVSAAAVLATVLIFLFQSFSRQIAEESQDNVLLASATSILESISARDGALSVDIPYAALSMLGSISDDRVFYRVDFGQETLTGYGDLPRATDLPNASGFTTVEYKGADTRIVSATRNLSVDGQSRSVIVSVGQTQEGLAERLRELFWTAILIGAGFFAFSAGLALWASSRVFRPLSALATSVSRRGPNDLRPFLKPAPEEMLPLVAALNGFTERLSRSLSRSEDFITEAAHRVRTPLATVRTQAEVLFRRIERDENRHAMREMIRAVDESSRAAGQLLDQAMVTLRTDALDRSDVDLAECLRDVVERFRAVADLRDIDLRMDLEPEIHIRADPILIQNAVTNLLDNAIKYAPMETEVSVSMHRDDKRIAITISDQGRGFDEDSEADLFARFVRGAASSGTVGSGLGLTIANEVFTAHGGAVELTNNLEGPGACVIAYLPA